MRLIASLIAALFLSIGITRAQTVWRMPTEYPASAMPGEGVAVFAAEVRKRLEGRLSIQPSYNAEMGFRSADMPAAVAAGRIEAADAFGGSLGQASVALALPSLPFLTASVDEAKRQAGIARPYYEKALDRMGLKLLYVTPWPPSGIWSRNALAGPADVRALSIRTYDATSTEVLTRAGARAQNLSFADVMPKLQDGSVTAVLSSGDGGAGRRLWTHLPHFTAVSYAVPLSFAFVGKAAFNALPPEQRAAVEEAAQATEVRQWQVIGGRLQQNYSTMRANGVIIAATIPEGMAHQLRIAAKPVVEAWMAAAGDEGRKVVEEFQR